MKKQVSGIYIDTDTIVFISLCITLRSRARHGGAFGASVYGGFLHRHLVENGRRTLVHKSGMGDPWVIIDGHSFRCHCICYMCEILALHTNTTIYFIYSTHIYIYWLISYYVLQVYICKYGNISQTWWFILSQLDPMTWRCFFMMQIHVASWCMARCRCTSWCLARQGWYSTDLHGWHPSIHLSPSAPALESTKFLEKRIWVIYHDIASSWKWINTMTLNYQLTDS